MRLALLLFMALSSSLSAATYTAASGSNADVQTAINSATSAGDIVEIPAGSHGWSGAVSWNAPANATLRGVGHSQVLGGGASVVIADNFSSGTELLRINIVSTGKFTLEGISFVDGTAGGGSDKNNGTVNISMQSGHVSGNVLIRYCTFDFNSVHNYRMLQPSPGVFGVAHHCLFKNVGQMGIYPVNGRLDSGTSDGVGNYEWTQATDFGGSTYFFVEDSGFYNTQRGKAWDGYGAAKMVMRFNRVTNQGLSEAHATGHAGNDRGTRSQEIYGNLAVTDLGEPPAYGVDMASGTALMWGNSFDGAFKSPYRFNHVRKSNETYGQTATPDGWGYSGTAFNGTGSNWDGGTYNSTSTTDGYPCLDQPGRGAGQLLRGLHPSKVNDATGTIAWPNQALEPIYIWSNVGSYASGWGDILISNNSGGRVAANRDYYFQASGIQTSATSPFNGTSGTGWGTLANRPTTCTTGVAYWATDQGDWNASTSNPYGVQQNGADGVLYVATATDTWTLYYEPYTYPHPLRSESGGSAPTLQSAVVSANGTTITLTWSVAATRGAGWSGSNIDIDGTSAGNNVAWTYSSGDGTTTWVGSISGATIYQGTSANLDFNGGANAIEDGSGVDTASITDYSLTNNSTQNPAGSSGRNTNSRRFQTTL